MRIAKRAAAVAEARRIRAISSATHLGSSTHPDQEAAKSHTHL